MIIAIKETDNVSLACSLGEVMFNSSKQDLIDAENLTMWKVENHKKCYMACSGLNFEADLIRYTKNLFPNKIDEYSLNKFFVPNIRNLLCEYNLATQEKWRNELIIVQDKTIYVVDRFFCVLTIPDFCAFGYGEDVIKGGLQSNKHNNTMQRLYNSFKVFNVSYSDSVKTVRIFVPRYVSSKI